MNITVPATAQYMGYTGSYVGDDTENKVIAHGCPNTPKFILVTESGNNCSWLIMPSFSKLFGLSGSASTVTVTAVTATDFYVGNIASYVNSANGNGLTYRWVAFP